MPERSRLIHIYTSPDKGIPMEHQDEIEAIAGVGLRGDRYAQGLGAWSKNRVGEVIRHVTLISAEDIIRVNAFRKIMGLPKFQPNQTRRNLVLARTDINYLIGREFSIGDVQMRGFEYAAPCERPSHLSGNPGFKESFEKTAGIRAEILTSGILQPGMLVTVFGKVK